MPDATLPPGPPSDRARVRRLADKGHRKLPLILRLGKPRNLLWCCRDCYRFGITAADLTLVETFVDSDDLNRGFDQSGLRRALDVPGPVDVDIVVRLDKTCHARSHTDLDRKGAHARLKLGRQARKLAWFGDAAGQNRLERNGVAHDVPRTRRVFGEKHGCVAKDRFRQGLFRPIDQLDVFFL